MLEVIRALSYQLALPGPSCSKLTMLLVNVTLTFQMLISQIWQFLNDILHMSFLAGIHVFKAFPAYTTTEI